MHDKTILIFGDVIGKIGREALTQALPDLRSQHQPDLVLANAENLAHGFGITPKTVNQMFEAGVDVLTSGNHVWSNPAYKEVFSDPEINRRVLRPLNDPRNEGIGYTIFNHCLIICLNGRTFIDEKYFDFIETTDRVLSSNVNEHFDAVLVDFHAEATSEKNVLGLYLDGRVSCVYGTHTHVQTADERILPKGTAYITDVGMVGAHNQAIGGKYEPILEGMKEGMLGKYEVPESGPVEINAILVKVKDGQAVSIKRIQQIIKM
ncbi:MAG: TIGR00282 family metallophosphoesterase [Candidatus Uhrbacteria bacterium]